MFTVPRSPLSSPPLGTIILGVAASDSHVVGNYLLAHYLREHGLEVVNLGVCTPLAEFMRAYEQHPDALAIAIGSLNGHAVEDLRQLALLKRRHRVTCPVFVGGNLSVGSQKRDDVASTLTRLGVTKVLASPEQLLAELRLLSGWRARARPLSAAEGAHP
ncbi:cobalamin-dependent protein [Haliangium ochraceum]|uniref:Cobalamin B12-binding domain protein n=1 Tax=Haliangium ochraceum (strain DSM 14365 / JCM 11303 / SMP-2) TaxID=502025 RepID=D0LME6_HALO1|nr:cobalamin-dependent protein [Haliangium ochraceum]ACY16852.1 cobalamin B12-binding domain protein [Haliangium ochraceum DSM 14365]